ELTAHRRRLALDRRLCRAAPIRGGTRGRKSRPLPEPAAVLAEARAGSHGRAGRPDRRTHLETQPSSSASSVISTPVSALETGQLDLAASAASRKAPASIPGTLPRTWRWIPVIPWPAWNPTLAEVASCSGGCPPWVRPLASAIEKQAAWAAPRSSSGLVAPSRLFARFSQLIASSPNAPEAGLTVPPPSIRLPCQTAAYKDWSRTRVMDRVRLMFSFKARLEGGFEDLARIVTRHHGKTLDEARGEVRRGVEVVDFACGAPTLLQGRTLRDVSGGVDQD